MQENHQAMKYFIQVPAAAACIKWGDAALRHRLTMVWQNVNEKQYGHHHRAEHPPRTCVLLYQLIDSIMGMLHGKSPMKMALLDLPEPSNTNSDSSKSKSSLEKVSSHSKQKNNSGSKGSTSDQKKPDHNLSLKLGKDSKLTPQSHNAILTTTLCLFCGTSGHITKGLSKIQLSILQGPSIQD